MYLTFPEQRPESMPFQQLAPCVCAPTQYVHWSFLRLVSRYRVYICLCPGCPVAENKIRSILYSCILLQPDHGNGLSLEYWVFSLLEKRYCGDMQSAFTMTNERNFGDIKTNCVNILHLYEGEDYNRSFSHIMLLKSDWNWKQSQIIGQGRVGFAHWGFLKGTYIKTD